MEVYSSIQLNPSSYISIMQCNKTSSTLLRYWKTKPSKDLASLVVSCKATATGTRKRQVHKNENNYKSFLNLIGAVCICTKKGVS